MRITRPWLVVVATIGIVATVVAAGLLWLLITQPVAVVEALGRRL